MGSSHQRQPLKRRNVFISSTNRDLAAHRKQVIDTLLRLGLFPVAIEPQGSDDATIVSTDKVAEADVYLGLFAWRYGTILPGETRSVTHLEYLEARKLGLPCFLFLAAPQTEQSYVIFPASTRDPEHRAQLQVLRKEIERAGAHYFTTPDDLAARVSTILNDWLLKAQEQELRSGTRPPRDLPPRASGFVGRTQELRTLSERLRRRQSVALAAALAGMGGVGKSALAAEVLHLISREPGAFPGGITWVRAEGRKELAGLVWVYEQLMTAWNVALTPEELPHATTLEAEADLRERVMRSRMRPPAPSGQRPPALVLVDNLEPGFLYNRALALFNTLDITVLLTSRAELSSPGLHLMPLDVLDPASAVQLFAQRYQEKGGAWNEARDQAYAAEAVKALGYLPLAIELAAARVARQRLGVEALARELRGLPTLDKLKDPLDPTGSVRYSFNKSLAQLSRSQQVRFAALGLPDGPDWPQPIVLRMFKDVPPGPPPTLPTADLDVLVGFSLVTLLPAEPFQASASPKNTAALLPRVRVHPLLRELAREEWAKQAAQTRTVALVALLDGTRALVEERRSDFRALAREEELVAGTLRKVAQARLEPETLNDVIVFLNDYFSDGSHWRLGMELIPLQLTACREAGQRGGEASALSNLGLLADKLGRWEEAARYYEQALALARRIGDQQAEGVTLQNLGSQAVLLGRKEAALWYLEQALSILRRVGDRKSESRTLTSLGALAESLGDWDRAARYSQQSLAIYREIGDRRGVGLTLQNLGRLAEQLGRIDEARRYHEQALAILREVGDQSAEGSILGYMGVKAMDQGNQNEAARQLEQALDIRHGIGDQQGEAETLLHKGRLAHEQGRIDEAVRWYEQSLRIRREIRDRRGEGDTLNALGYLANELGRKEEAARHLEQALHIRREIGDQRGQGESLNNLGRLMDELGRKEEAVRYYEQALAILRKIGYRQGEGAILNNLGLLVSVLGRKEEATRYYEQALVIAREVGDRHLEGTTLNNLGKLVNDLGRKEGAARYYEQALLVHRTVGDRTGEATTLNNLGALAKDLGRKEEAARHFERALTILEEMSAVDSARIVRKNLAVLKEEMDKQT